MRSPFARIVAAVTGAAFRLFELPMRYAQTQLGVRRLAWLFLAPNLLIFGTYTFLPIVINVYYAFTGGVKLYPSERPFLGAENLVRARLGNASISMLVNALEHSETASTVEFDVQSTPFSVFDEKTGQRL